MFFLAGAEGCHMDWVALPSMVYSCSVARCSVVSCHGPPLWGRPLSLRAPYLVLGNWARTWSPPLPPPATGTRCSMYDATVVASVVWSHQKGHRLRSVGHWLCWASMCCWSSSDQWHGFGGQFVGQSKKSGWLGDKAKVVDLCHI